MKLARRILPAAVVPLALALAISLPLSAQAVATYTVLSGADESGFPTLTYTFTGDPESDVVLIYSDAGESTLSFDVPYTFGCVDGRWAESQFQFQTARVDLGTIDPATFDVIVTESIIFDDSECVAAGPEVPAGGPDVAAPVLPSMGVQPLLAGGVALGALALGGIALVGRRIVARS